MCEYVLVTQELTREHRATEKGETTNSSLSDSHCFGLGKKEGLGRSYYHIPTPIEGKKKKSKATSHTFFVPFRGCDNKIIDDKIK